MNTEAWIVVDLGFGDAGKGTVVDFLVRNRSARTVVRFNGGAQAGHNVVLSDGRHHTFTQFGASTFVPGVRTHLAPTVLVHPPALLAEAERLQTVGVSDALDRLTIDEDAMVITPFHQAGGRLRELARGDAAHGTCGVGIGETMRDHLAAPELTIRMRDLLRPAALVRQLTALADYKRSELTDVRSQAHRHPDAATEERVFDDPEIIERWIAQLAPLLNRNLVVGGEHFTSFLNEGVVFEGAQGVLLDEEIGFHPHTTWSRCTTHHALGLLNDHGYDGPIRRLGVLRSYATRHGAGPFPTHAPELNDLDEPHNTSDGWQGSFRRGWFDTVLARYALAACPIDALALTHLDRIPSQICTAYRSQAPIDGPEWVEDPTDPNRIVDIIPPRGEDLDRQERLGQTLNQLEAELDTLPPGPEAFLERIAHELRTPVGLISRGPCAEHKQLL